jgi:hypothetical protein
MKSTNKKYALMTLAGAYIIEAKSKTEAFSKLKNQIPNISFGKNNIYKYN